LRRPPSGASTTSRYHEGHAPPPPAQSAERERGGLLEVCFFDTELTACTGITHEELLPSAFCVQRFSNGMILQYIPLIALCCVLHRYGKPSHPSRHVLDATQDAVRLPSWLWWGSWCPHTHTHECVRARHLAAALCLCGSGLGRRAFPGSSLSAAREVGFVKTKRFVFRKNDPAAGSPTATLLRLLLPLLKKYR
jgi:hypothetical protein